MVGLLYENMVNFLKESVEVIEVIVKFVVLEGCLLVFEEVVW